MVPHQGLGLGHGGRRLAGLQHGVDAGVDGREPQLVEPGDRALGELVEAEVGIGRASPEGQRLIEASEGGGGVPAFAAWLAVFREDRPGARRWAEAGVEQADALGFGQLRVLCRVMGAAGRSDPATRLDELSAAADEWEAHGARLYRSFFSTLRAGALLDLHRPDDALPLLTAALDAAAASGERFFEPETHASSVGPPCNRSAR